ncbi:MAG: Mu transposase C-terminal domain-containing protein [Acidobacteriota bacterium]|nr:Mu transposase C-terminal domain-containing protein [Acidobacteriota bacterium]
MQKWQQWQVASQADWGIAVEREVIIRLLAERDRLSPYDVDEATVRLQIGRSFLYKLIRRYKQRPQTSSLLPWKRGRDNSLTFLDRTRESLLSSCIKDFYLRPERPSLAALVQEVKRQFAEQDLPAPNYRTVRRRVEGLDLGLVIRKREGSKRAREKVGPVNVSSLQPALPMDVLQIDHTPVDVMVVDAERRLSIGRPWLTVAIDVTTRMVAGFHVSLWAPSALSVSLTLSHAVLSKTTWLADRELQTLTWPAAGLPRVIHVDNAKEFHSDALVRGCQEYGVQLDHRPRARPHFGGHIERYIGTMMGAVHLLPGTTFSNVSEKGDYPSEERARLTLPELERWLALQIAGVYHLSIHSALGTTPLAAWEQGITRRKQPPRYPPDETEFFLDFLPAVPRRIQRDGIHFCKIRYWDSILSPWAGRLKQLLLVKYDPRNLSRVYVRDPNGRHWPIPYANLGQPPIALWELEEARKELGKEGKRAHAEKAIFASIAEQRRIVNNAVRSSKQRRRQEKLPADSPVNGQSVNVRGLPDVDAAEIKPYPVEIWEAD